MVSEFQKILKTMADKMMRHGARVQFSAEDLVNVGLSAIWKARHRFDPSRASWRTYGSLKAWHAMQDELRALDHVPRLTRARAKKSGEQLRKVETLDDDFKLTVLDGRSASPLRGAEDSELWKQLPRTIGARAAQIVERYYRRGQTLKQIGLEMGLSESRVCQIHAKSIQRLQWRGRGYA